MALALVAAGCVKVDMDFVVNDDGSGSFSQKITLAEPVIELMVGSGQAGTRAQACGSFIAESEANESIIDFSTAGVDTSDLDSIVSVFESVNSDSECSTTQGFSWSAAQYGVLREVMAVGEGPQILQLEDGWRFELSSSFMSQGPSEDESAQLFSLGLDPPTAVISVTLPGEPLEHNADSVADSTFAWKFDLTDPQSAPEGFVAQTTLSSGGIGPEAIAGIVVGAVVLLLAIVAMLRRRSVTSSPQEGRGGHRG
ncbi:hypothetical protein [Candidatus Poriferisodalis sp.]|uniref:hypothetical protein n=1 Tax=Candidatus Poriferisodalis sp. TaxID=3101277 RepID=UPI003B593695